MAYDARPTTIESLVDRCCSEYLIQPDWEKNMQMVDLIKRKPKLAKPILKEIRKKWKVKKDLHRVALFAITLLETLVKNCWYAFIEVHNTDYQQALQRLAQQKQLHYSVKEKLVEFIMSCAESTRADVRFGNFEKTYRKLRQKGVLFPNQAPSFAIPAQPRTPLIPGTTTRTTRVAYPAGGPRYPVRRTTTTTTTTTTRTQPGRVAQRRVAPKDNQITMTQKRHSVVTKLDEDTPKLTLLREMLMAFNAEKDDITTDDVINDLMASLKTLHGEIQEWLATGGFEDGLVARMIHVNDTLLELFQAQEDIRRGIQPTFKHSEETPTEKKPSAKKNETEDPIPVTHDLGNLSFGSTESSLGSLSYVPAPANQTPTLSSTTADTKPKDRNLLDDLISFDVPAPNPAVVSSPTPTHQVQPVSHPKNDTDGLVSLPPLEVAPVYGLQTPAGMMSPQMSMMSPPVGMMSPSMGMMSPSMGMMSPPMGMMSPPMGVVAATPVTTTTTTVPPVHPFAPPPNDGSVQSPPQDAGGFDDLDPFAALAQRKHAQPVSPSQPSSVKTPAANPFAGPVASESPVSLPTMENRGPVTGESGFGFDTPFDSTPAAMTTPFSQPEAQNTSVGGDAPASTPFGTYNPFDHPTHSASSPNTAGVTGGSSSNVFRVDDFETVDDDFGAQLRAR